MSAVGWVYRVCERAKSLYMGVLLATWEACVYRRCVWMSAAQVCLWEEITCVRRGSISAASCFLSPSLRPHAPSLESMTGFFTTLSISVCVCVRACTAKVLLVLHVCFPVYLSMCPTVCVLPLACLTPHLLLRSQQAFHWAVIQFATVLPLNRAGLWG